MVINYRTVIISNKQKLAVRIFIGFVLAAGAIAKLIAIDSFEIYLYSFGLLKLDYAFLLARLVISLELFLGVLLMVGMHTNKAIPATIVLLSIFSVFILYLLFSRKNEQCHCFGDVEISNQLSLLKNVFLILFLFISRKVADNQFKYGRVSFVIVSLSCLVIPLIASPPDSFFYNTYSKDLTYKEIVLNAYLKENAQYDKGKNIVCFFSSGCGFCKLAAKKVSVMAKKANASNMVQYVFAGAEVSVTDFFRETNSTIFQYTFIPAKRFLNLTNGEMPLIILVEDGHIKGKYGYRDLNEAEMIEFMKELKKQK